MLENVSYVRHTTDRLLKPVMPDGNLQELVKKGLANKKQRAALNKYFKRLSLYKYRSNKNTILSKDDRVALLNSFRRQTWAYVIRGDEKVCVAMSEQGDGDRFVKSIGRDLSKERLERLVVDESNWMSVEEMYNDPSIPEEVTRVIHAELTLNY